VGNEENNVRKWKIWIFCCLGVAFPFVSCLPLRVPYWSLGKYPTHWEKCDPLEQLKISKYSNVVIPIKFYFLSYLRHADKKKAYI